MTVDEMYRTLGRFRWRVSRYRNTNASLTKAALAAKRLRGERAGNIPFGYQLGEDGKLKPCPTELSTLASLRQLRDAGYSLRAVADELNRQGFTTRRGSAWRFEYVRRLEGKAA